MTTQTMSAEIAGRKDWGEAFAALRRLLANASDTAQVFRIMRALNAGVSKKGYERLLRTPEGGAIAYQRVELAERFSDPAFIASFPQGSLGAVYARFLQDTGYSAQGLADVSRTDTEALEAQHPYAWYGRRTRDVHDIWHILTGYSAEDPLGEACLTAFSFAQTGGLGWAAIAVGGTLSALGTPMARPTARAIWEGYRNGRRAAWLLGEDYEKMLAEPIGAVRARLNINEPAAYRAAKATPPPLPARA